MRATDQMLARFAAEIEERNAFADGIVEGAEKDNRDLDKNEMELVTRAKDRVQELSVQMQPLMERRRIGQESSANLGADRQLVILGDDGDAVPFLIREVDDSALVGCHACIVPRATVRCQGVRTPASGHNADRGRGLRLRCRRGERPRTAPTAQDRPRGRRRAVPPSPARM